MWTLRLQTRIGRTTVPVLVATLLGCSGSDASVNSDHGGWQESGGTGGGAGAGGALTDGGGTSGGSGACTEGLSCLCDDGREGETQCSSGSQSCSCESCPAFTPGTESVPFTPCGGEPFGVWRSTSNEMSSLMIGLYSGSSTAETCLTELESQDSPMDFRLELNSGGTGRLYTAGPRVTFQLLNSCSQDAIGIGCEELEAPGNQPTTCSEGQCGICTCTSEKSPNSWSNLTWSRSGSELTLLADGDQPFTLSYCAGNRVMMVQLSERETVTMALTALSGSPLACEQRSESECLLSYGCRMGACVGESSCNSAESEADCTNQMGCTWDPTKCAGQATGKCSLGDYGIVPGCDMTDGEWGCTGAPPACSSQDVANCKWGCTLTGQCTGGTISCTSAGGIVPSKCMQIVGCHLSVDPPCTGTAYCDEQTQENVCSYTDCAWLEHCEGTATPCEQYNQTTCGTVPGCMWEIVPI